MGAILAQLALPGSTFPPPFHGDARTARRPLDGAAVAREGLRGASICTGRATEARVRRVNGGQEPAAGLEGPAPTRPYELVRTLSPPHGHDDGPRKE
ncbi:hypothetical protein [Streptomyces sp. NPDC001774]